MLLAKLKYYFHIKLAVYYDRKADYAYEHEDGTKWLKYNDKFWKHMDIANYIRDKYKF